MKTLAILALPTLALPFVAARPAQNGPVSAPAAAIPTRLGNGGFESWPFGHISDGPNPPDQWWTMGTTANLFTQTAIEFKRVDSPAGFPCGPGPRGKYYVEMTPTDPGNYVAQPIENFAEFRCKPVTFSVDLSTPFGIAQPEIAVDDGVSITSNSIVVTSDAWTRLTVIHEVDPSATKLELRIKPNETIVADNAQMIVGKLADAPYVPRQNPEAGLMETPLGSIIDWWRFNPNQPLPDGYAIADGSVVSDVESPFFGFTLPDLSDRFVLGVTSMGEIGEAGGVASLNLNHNHPIPHTHSGTTQTSAAGACQVWAHPDGFCWAIDPQHTHTFTTGGPSNGNSGSALGTIDNRPPFLTLLKIVRIK